MKQVIFVLALAVAAAGCIDSTENSPETDSPNQTSAPVEPVANSSEGNTVYLTESGFQPSELTIRQGETVTWINNASGSMWIGSDNHPTHTEYSGSTIMSHCSNGDQTEAAFDQCHSSDEFSFTFEKTGEWGYHNHENAGRKGAIIVE